MWFHKTPGGLVFKDVFIKPLSEFVLGGGFVKPLGGSMKLPSWVYFLGLVVLYNILGLF